MSDQSPDLIELIDRLDSDIAEIRQRCADAGEDRSEDIAGLEEERDRLIGEYFRRLLPWDEVRLARHPKRPYTLDYLRSAFDDFVELRGDRRFADDAAIVGGLGWISGYPVVVFGHQKGRDIKERKLRNFGSTRPEGYRKALRLMELAQKYRKPVVAIIDTPAADCSVGSEERGISEAIARNLMEMFRVRVPIVVVVIGEGGSGGALGIGVGDRVLMLEHAIYSVIPPEGCAAILWRDSERKVDAAQALRLTAKDALSAGLIDEIVHEPFGAAHRNPEGAAENLRQAIVRALGELCPLDVDELLERRYQKFRAMGLYDDPDAAPRPHSAAGKNGRKTSVACSASGTAATDSSGADSA